MTDGILIHELDSSFNEKWQGAHSISYTLLTATDFKPKVNAPSYYDASSFLSDDFDDGKPGTGYQSLNTSPKGQNLTDLIRQSFDNISKYANVTFTPVSYSYGNVGVGEKYGDIVIGASKFKNEQDRAFSADLDSSVGGDIWLNTTFLSKLTTTNEMILSTITHEMLHSLGFKHVAPDTGGENYVPYFDHHQNRIIYTQMSYNRVSQNDAKIFDVGPMLYDVAFLQYLYGARASDPQDIYSFTGNVPDLAVIWDTGSVRDRLVGRDDINANLSLVPGTHSSIVPGGAAFGSADAAAGRLYNNVAIAFNTIIEDCDGGAKADTIVGNHVGNVVRGMAGNDKIFGSKVEYLARYPSDNWLSKYTYQDQVENVADPTDADTLYGGAGSDRIWGGLGNDMLFGDGGAETMDSGGGADTIYGGAGADTIYGGVGSDSIHGGTTGTKAIDIADGIDVMDYSRMPTTRVAIKASYYDDRWIVTKTDSAGLYTGTDTLQSIEQIIGNRNTIFDLHKSATPKPGAVLGSLQLNGGAVLHYTDDGENNDVIAQASLGISISQIGNIMLGSGGSWDGDVVFQMGGGNDRVGSQMASLNLGSQSDVTINGGAGNDIIWSNADSVSGGAGDDIIQLSGYSGGDVTIDGGVGNDVVYFSGRGTVYAGNGDVLNLRSSDYDGKLFINGSLITNVNENSNGDMIDNAGNIWQVQVNRVVINNSIVLYSPVAAYSTTERFLGVYYNDPLNKNGYDLYVGGEDKPGTYTYSGGAFDDTFVVVNKDGVRSVVNAGAGDDKISFSAPNNDYVDGGLGSDGISFSASLYGSVDMSRKQCRVDGVTSIKFTSVENFSIYGGNIKFLSNGDMDDSVSMYGTGILYASLGKGDDVLFGGNSGSSGPIKSVIYTGSGQDYLYFTSTTAASINTGSGHDYIQAGYYGPTLPPPSGLVATISSGTGADEIYYRNSVVNGLLNGEEGADTIVATLGNNTIHGGMGDDVIKGGSGNDQIVWISGSDIIDGGAGNDVLNIQMRSEQIAGATATPGGIMAWLANQGVVVTNVETVQIVAKNIVMGTPGADNLSGSAGADTIWGFDGADTITGGAADTLIGGNGADVFVITGAAVVVVDDDQSAADVIRFGTGITSVTSLIIEQNLQLTTNIGTIVTIVNQFVDDIVAVGSVILGNGTVVNLASVSLVQNGTAGNDSLEGIYGRNDSISGLAGNDTILGYEGADTLLGGLGNDWIEGNAGNDRLTGGTGADKFVLNGPTPGADVVTDFVLAQGDRIVLATGTAYTTTDLGADIKITFGANSVILTGVADFATTMIEFA